MKRTRISLHELTALQVDIDGKRVQPPGRQGKSAASRRDIMGNVINPRPYKRRHHLKSVEHSHSRDEIDGDVAASSLTESIRAASPSAGLRSDGDGKQESKKRKRDEYFPGVLPYLHPPKRHRSGTPDNSSEDEMPSSMKDLLKTIHHYAGAYYDERGMLTASQSLHAKEQRERRDQSTMADERADSVGSKESAEDIGMQQEKPSQSQIRDMYRAFDGSALLFIGMLVHEHVVSRMNRPDPPLDEWEKRVQADKERVRRLRKPRRKVKQEEEEEDADADEVDNEGGSSDEEKLENVESDKDDMGG
ncbi:SubName: Full=Uncharacterized protein {ECO:0000313/EMBL:CCA69038.1} [Serendipita indica DSM 11827]|nr:SubName: Full=Uncharacterized protein {ECO:0000313/EMBL:CCA69038.1} [Serendipita indica DSM 11827]